MKVAVITESQLEQAYNLGGLICSIIYDLAHARDYGTDDEVAFLEAGLKLTREQWAQLQDAVFSAGNQP